MVYPGNSSCILLQGKEESLKILASELNLVSGEKKKNLLNLAVNQDTFLESYFFSFPRQR